MGRVTKVDLMLSVTVLLWALNFSVTRYAVTHGWNPLAYSSIRYTSAALLFAGVTARIERTFRIARRRDVSLLLAAAVLGIWANQLSYVYAIKLTTAATVALILGVTPVFAAIGGSLVGLERPSARFWLAAGVSLAGAVLVALGHGGSVEIDPAGNLLSVLTAATWAAYTIVIAPLMRRYSPYRISAIVLAAGAVPLAATGASQIAAQDFGSLPALAWAAIVYAMLGPLVVTNVLWFRSVAAVGPSHATLFANVQPFVAAVFAVLILSESLTAVQLAGGIAIGAGVVLSRHRRKEELAPVPAGE